MEEKSSMMYQQTEDEKDFEYALFRICESHSGR